MKKILKSSSALFLAILAISSAMSGCADLKSLAHKDDWYNSRYIYCDDSYAADIYYREDGQVESESLNFGIARTEKRDYAFDEHGRVSAITVNDSEDLYGADETYYGNFTLAVEYKEENGNYIGRSQSWNDAFDYESFYEYTYDSDYRLIEMLYQGRGQIECYKFDERSNIVESYLERAQEHKRFSTEYYTYNSKNNVISHIIVDENGDSFASTYEYDKSGENIIRAVEKDCTRINEYDKNGDFVKTTLTDKNPEYFGEDIADSVFIYEKETDSTFKVWMLDSNGAPSSIVRINEYDDNGHLIHAIDYNSYGGISSEKAYEYSPRTK